MSNVRSLFPVHCEVGSGKSILMSLDPFGDTNLIGDLGIEFIRGGFSHRPNGELHLLYEGGNLYQVHPRTGMATLTGNLGYPEVEASAFSADGYLYVAVSEVVDSRLDDNIVSLDRLLRVHPNSVSTTVIGEIGADIDGMTFLPNGGLVGVDTGADENGNVFNNAHWINSETGAGTLLRSLRGFNIIALALLDDMLLELDSRGGLLQLDPTTWQANILAALEYPTTTLAPGTAPPLAYGDFFRDGHTGLADHAIFETCNGFSGPAVNSPFGECLDVFDWDDDGDVNIRDFRTFQLAFH